jgi:hypothetical protein
MRKEGWRRDKNLMFEKSNRRALRERSKNKREE